MVIEGAYGPYIKGLGRRNNLKVPKDVDAKKLTKKQAEEMLLKRFGTKAISGSTAVKKRTTKRSTTKKSSKKTTKK